MGLWEAMKMQVMENESKGFEKCKGGQKIKVTENARKRNMGKCKK